MSSDKCPESISSFHLFSFPLSLLLLLLFLCLFLCLGFFFFFQVFFLFPFFFSFFPSFLFLLLFIFMFIYLFIYLFSFADRLGRPGRRARPHHLRGRRLREDVEGQRDDGGARLPHLPDALHEHVQLHAEAQPHRPPRRRPGRVAQQNRRPRSRLRKGHISRVPPKPTQCLRRVPSGHREGKRKKRERREREREREERE